MGVDPGVVSVSVEVEVGGPTTTDGRGVGLPPSVQSVASPMHPPEEPTGPPKAKKRRVMFADE